jgi:hypothetical protein
MTLVNKKIEKMRYVLRFTLRFSNSHFTCLLFDFYFVPLSFPPSLSFASSLYFSLTHTLFVIQSSKSIRIFYFVQRVSLSICKISFLLVLPKVSASKSSLLLHRNFLPISWLISTLSCYLSLSLSLSLSLPLSLSLSIFPFLSI